MIPRFTAVDVFCGVGGMSLGFEQAGFDVRVALDDDPIHSRAYKKNFPATVVLQRDIRGTRGDDIAELLQGNHVDVVFGGAPCQGFSLIGKRDPADPRNELIEHFGRIVLDLRPNYFVLENVAGLLAGDAKLVLEKLVHQVRSQGFEVVEPVMVLNAKDFGIPQRRKRLFVLGHRKDISPPTYPEPAGVAPTVGQAIGDLPNVDEHDYLLSEDLYGGPLGIPSTYAANLRSGPFQPNCGSYPRHPVRGLSGCMRTRHSDETVRRFSVTAPGDYEPVSRFYRLEWNGLAPTLRAGTGTSHGSFTVPRPIHPTADRCLTVREAARLHSFPDWFEFDPTKWHGFRQVGNAVPPKMARAVADSIMRAGSFRKD